MARAGLFGYRLGSGVGAMRIDGLRETQISLAKLGSDAKNDMKPAHKAAAEMVVQTAKPLAPVVTGALRDSMRPIAYQKSGVVRVGNKSVPYAGPIIFGWPKRAIKANPFIYDALDRRKTEVVDTYDRRMKEVIAKNGLSLGPPHHFPTGMAQAVTGQLA